MKARHVLSDKKEFTPQVIEITIEKQRDAIALLQLLQVEAVQVALGELGGTGLHQLRTALGDAAATGGSFDSDYIPAKNAIIKHLKAQGAV